jgi:two-component system chemotaxis response regulator CheY
MTGANAAQRTVLVVDDDPDIRETLEIVLGAHGYGVVVAEDGVEALAYLRARGGRPCVVLLDLMMPRMNGLELRREMAADPFLSAIPVVVITGAGTYAQGRTRDLNTQMLPKPFDLRTLLSTVQRLCS